MIYGKEKVKEKGKKEDFSTTSKEKKMSGKDYKEIVEEYKKVNLDISNRIITLSITAIAAIFVISEKYGAGALYLASLFGLILTVTIHIANNICFSKHYELALDGKINNIHYANSRWGRCSEILYWIFICAFVISMIIFFAALWNSIDIVNQMPTSN